MSAQMKEAAVFVEQYFTDEPEASIDSCVRDALSMDIPVTRDMVSGIRRTLRQRPPVLSLVHSLPADKVPPGAKVQTVQGYAKNPSKPPQWFIDKQKREDELFFKMQAEEVPFNEPPVAKVSREKSTTEQLERRRYFETILLDDPTQTVVCAMRKVKDKFGTSVDPGFAVRTLHLVRELAGVTEGMIVKQGDNKPLTHKLALPATTPVTSRVVPKEVTKPTVEEDMYAVFYGEIKRFLPKRDLETEIQKLTVQGVSGIRVFLLKELKMKTVVTVNVSFE